MKKNMKFKKRKTGNGTYEYRGFTIEKNIFKQYGMPKSAYVVSADAEGNNDELGPSWIIKDAMNWIDWIIDVERKK